MERKTYKALNYWVFGGFGPAKTPYEFIDFAARQGLDGVELTVGDCLNADVDEAECRRIRAYAKEKKVGLRTLATGAGWATWLCSADAKERRAAKDFCRKYLQIAAWLGAETVLVVPGALKGEGGKRVDYASAWKFATASLKELETLAAKLKVNVGVENVWNHFLFSPMEWKTFLDQFTTGRIGIYFDIGNCQLYVDAADYVKILGRRIKAVHVKNWAGHDSGGDLLGFGEDIFKGDVDVKGVVAALAKMNPRLPFTGEMIPFCRGAQLGIPDARLAAATAKKMREL